MEETSTSESQEEKKAEIAKPVKTRVYVMRDFMEYFGESVLIVFSVLLALFLTELITKAHDKEQTKSLLANIKAELIKNKQAEELQYAYQVQVLKAIDSALNNESLQKKIVANGEFHLVYIAPAGITYRYLSSVAWQVAQSQNITSKTNFKLVTQLTSIYDDQARIDKLDDKVSEVMLSYNSRNIANARETLILIRDNYKGWAFDRAKGLLYKYDEAIKAISE